jgi:hypothetical protein
MVAMKMKFFAFCTGLLATYSMVAVDPKTPIALQPVSAQAAILRQRDTVTISQEIESELVELELSFQKLRKAYQEAASNNDAQRLLSLQRKISIIKNCFDAARYEGIIY